MKEAEVRSRITGVQAQMSNFSFHWGINLGESLLRHADNLSKTLHNPKLSTASGQEIASKTVETLQHIPNERDFNLFYDMVLKHKEHLEDRVAQPKLPRKQENGMFQDTFKLELHLQSILPPQKINTEWNTFWHWIIL